MKIDNKAFLRKQAKKERKGFYFFTFILSYFFNRTKHEKTKSINNIPVWRKSQKRKKILESRNKRN
jgi:hypothetical protein